MSNFICESKIYIISCLVDNHLRFVSQIVQPAGSRVIKKVIHTTITLPSTNINEPNSKLRRKFNLLIIEAILLCSQIHIIRTIYKLNP